MAVAESCVIGTHPVMDEFGNNLMSTDLKPKIIPQQSCWYSMFTFLETESTSKSWNKGQRVHQNYAKRKRNCEASSGAHFVRRCKCTLAWCNSKRFISTGALRRALQLCPVKLVQLTLKSQNGARIYEAQYIWVIRHQRIWAAKMLPLFHGFIRPVKVDTHIHQ